MTAPVVLRCLVSGMCACIALRAFAVSKPHPTRADRLVEERDGLRVEFSPGLEAHVEPALAKLASWQAERSELLRRLAANRPTTAAPFSAADMRTRRDEILAQVARETGLKRPTALQGRTYDAMLEYYELLTGVHALLPIAAEYAADCREVQVWRRDELIRRLSAGEKISGFTYDPATNQGNFSFNLETAQVPDDEQRAARERFERNKLDHAFNYHAGKDGVVTLSASINLPAALRAAPLQPPERENPWGGRVDELRSQLDAQADGVAMPVVLSEKNADWPPERHAESVVAGLRDFVSSMVGRAPYRDPALACLILHEAAEVGIVENFIGSGDRRWLCDGAANYVAWKVIRDGAGEELARQGYDLGAQLRRYAEQQPQIRLRQWRAVENTKEDERETVLTKAHYAFATRALFDLVKAKGESAVPKLFEEIARTPRAKVTMATVEQAYRKVGGGKLADWLHAAESAPIPPVPAAPVTQGKVPVPPAETRR